MTTITIQKGQDFLKTDFETPQELFVFLREKLTPVSIYLVDDESIPKSILDSIEKAENEGDSDTKDFQG